MKMIYKDTTNVNMAGHPVCQDCVDVAVSPAGDRAFLGCQASNNLCLADYLTNYNNNEVRAATAYAGGAGPGIREVVWTPYNNKVLAAIWFNTMAGSKLMILDSDSVSVGFGGTISTNYYSFISGTSANQIYGPEGIGVWPHFDRDGDKISDLIEATNYDTEFTAGRVLAFHLDPTFKEGSNLIAAIGQPGGAPDNGYLRNGIKLPEEGIGYRHFYGTDPLNFDNWGTLRLVKTIEAVAKDWNLKHPEGPRISIGDMSKRQGGDWHPDHDSHQNGRDVDIRYILSNHAEGPTDFCRGYPNCDEANPANYDHDLTSQLINLFVKQGVSLVLVDPDAGIPQGGVIQWDGQDGNSHCGTPDAQKQKCINKDRGHSNHFHIRIP
jgi:hypothetical protein